MEYQAFDNMMDISQRFGYDTIRNPHHNPTNKNYLFSKSYFVLSEYITSYKKLKKYQLNYPLHLKTLSPKYFRPNFRYDNKEFNLENPPSWDRIDCKLPHTLQNIILTCVPCNVERSNRSLELMQTIIQRKQYAVNNFFPLVLTNIHVVEQMQNAIVGGLSNVWHRSNIAGETFISYLTYDYINKKVYSTDTKNKVTHITGVDFNALYPSAYGSIPNEMIGYTGNKMLMPGNLKEYITDKQRILEIIFTKKELFVVTLKGGIPEDSWNEFINNAPIIRNIEIGNDKSKRKQKKLTQLMTTMGLYMPFSSYYLWYMIDGFGFVIEDVTEMSVFYANENGLFTMFTIQLMEERMKAIEQKNDGYGTFCKNILNAAYGKDGMN
jgi:hypothetical protein